MESLVLKISAKADTDREIARRAVSVLFVYVMQWTAPGDWSELSSTLPGAGKASSAGSLRLTVTPGGRLIAMDGLINPLLRSGLSFQQIPAVVGLFLDFMKSNAGHSLASRVVATMPSLTTIAFLDSRNMPLHPDRHPERPIC